MFQVRSVRVPPRARPFRPTFRIRRPSLRLPRRPLPPRRRRALLPDHLARRGSRRRRVLPQSLITKLLSNLISAI